MSHIHTKHTTHSYINILFIYLFILEGEHSKFIRATEKRKSNEGITGSTNGFCQEIGFAFLTLLQLIIM